MFDFLVDKFGGDDNAASAFVAWIKNVEGTSLSQIFDDDEFEDYQDEFYDDWVQEEQLDSMFRSWLDENGIYEDYEEDMAIWEQFEDELPERGIQKVTYKHEDYYFYV